MNLSALLPLAFGSALLLSIAAALPFISTANRADEAQKDYCIAAGGESEMNTEIRIDSAYEEIHEAKKRLSDLLSAIISVGDMVDYEVRSGVAGYGEVLAIGSDGVKVRARTGKEYWISAYQITHLER